MAGLPMMPWYPRDFLSSTRTWPLIARAIYRELLDAQWDSGSLPASPSHLRSMVGATAAQWRAAWPLIECKMPVGTDGQRRNLKLEEHREKATAFTESRRRGASITNAKLRAQRTLSVTLSDSHSDTPPSPSPIGEKKKSKAPAVPAASDFDEQFAQLKATFPKRAGQHRWERARKHLNARLKAGWTWPTIISAAERYATFVRATGQEGQRTVMQAATFVGEDHDENFRNDWETPASSNSGDRKEAVTAWSKAIACVRSGEYRRGKTPGGRIDEAVRALGGYGSIGSAREDQLRFIENRFVEAFRP